MFENMLYYFGYRYKIGYFYNSQIKICRVIQQNTEGYLIDLYGKEFFIPVNDAIELSEIISTDQIKSML